MKNGMIIKKIKNGLKIAVATTLLALSLTSCAGPCQEYVSQEEIIDISNDLECDTGYINEKKDNFVRMKHNDGEPIYVCFDSAYSEDLKTKAIESLDYVFGIVGKINDNYKYQVVNKAIFDLLPPNRTKIYYTLGELPAADNSYEVYGHIVRHLGYIDSLPDDPLYYYYEVKMDEDFVNNADEASLKYTLNHELLHAFGFADVYNNSKISATITKFQGNTYMNNTFKWEMITPNDLACLISLYSDDDCDIEKMKYYLEKYKTKYYNSYTELCKDKLGTNENLNEEDFSFCAILRIEDIDKSKYGYKYEITVENGEYNLEIYDYFSNELIDSCQGKTTNQNGVVVLKNVELKVGLKPNYKQENYSGGYVQDLVIANKDGRAVLYNYHLDTFLSGAIHNLEKSLTY